MGKIQTTSICCRIGILKYVEPTYYVPFFAKKLKTFMGLLCKVKLLCEFECYIKIPSFKKILILLNKGCDVSNKTIVQWNSSNQSSQNKRFHSAQL